MISYLQIKNRSSENNKIVQLNRLQKQMVISVISIYVYCDTNEFKTTAIAHRMSREDVSHLN